MNWKLARKFRQGVQIAFFLLFIYLMFATVQRQTAPALADLFFRLNPLSAMSVMLASRAWIPRLGLALITVVATVLVGRVWCGWICPTGTLLEWISFRQARKRAIRISPKLRVVKYLLLICILAAAIFGNLTLMVFEPLSLATRSMTAAVIPALDSAVNATEHLLYNIPFLQPAVDVFDELVRGSLIPVKQPAFSQNALIALILLAVLGLNLWAHRFWCRYMCPLGALLGLLAKVSILRPGIGKACNECGACSVICRPGAIEKNVDGHRIRASECTVCLDCMAKCPQTGIGFQPTFKPATANDFDPSRRQALGALAGAAAGVLVLNTDLRVKEKNPFLMRPPGVQDEASFLSTCLRCSQCMKICPTSALQPALFQAGLEGLWTPVLTPRVGYCDFGCNACGQVCPSQAIPRLALEDKRLAVVGKASVNRNRCLPWSSDTPCIVCEEMCPTPQKAIRLEEINVTGADGSELKLQRPYVLRDVCIGCGICENRCPLEGEAGIKVYQIL